MTSSTYDLAVAGGGAIGLACAWRAAGRGLRTPATGVPMTPYSPYMPYTPITPVTPHLVTRKERKLREKEQKKMGLRTPLAEGDEVGAVDWGDAY